KCELVPDWRSARVSCVDSCRAMWLVRAGDVRRSPENRYQRLSVAELTGARHAQHVAEGQPVHLEDLVLFGPRRQRGQLRGEVQMNDFCKNAGRAQGVP